MGWKPKNNHKEEKLTWGFKQLRCRSLPSSHGWQTLEKLRTVDSQFSGLWLQWFVRVIICIITIMKLTPTHYLSVCMKYTRPFPISRWLRPVRAERYPTILGLYTGVCMYMCVHFTQIVSHCNAVLHLDIFSPPKPILGIFYRMNLCYSFFFF